jgi:hypothetical protein
VWNSSRSSWRRSSRSSRRSSFEEEEDLHTQTYLTECAMQKKRERGWGVGEEEEDLLQQTYYHPLLRGKDNTPSRRRSRSRRRNFQEGNILPRSTRIRSYGRGGRPCF